LLVIGSQATPSTNGATSVPYKADFKATWQSPGHLPL
jgi:hypothetical protein